MANLNATLSLGGHTFSVSKNYSQVYENITEVDNADGFINVLTVSGTKGANTVPSLKTFCVQNTGGCAAEIQFLYQEWKNNSNVDDQNAAARYATMILPAGEFFYLPHGRLIGYSADESAANATEIDNTAPNSNRYTDSGANLAAPVDSPDTTITVTDGDFFKVGDLIQFGDDNATATKLEVMEVTAISGVTLTVTRALYGSNLNDKDAQTDGTDGVVSGANVYFPFFNAYNKFNKYSTSQTNKDGKFRAMNFFGYGRTADAIADGIQSGSVAIKFYSSGYQELGLSGISASTHTGLTASTDYQFTITVDGGSAYDLDLTTDSSNLNFGGKNGLLNKLNDIFATQYRTFGSNLFETAVTVGLVGGDVRFTSGSHLSTSAISLGDSSGGDTDIWGAGRIPAVANVEGAVASELPDDVIYDSVTYDSTKNKSAFMYDDGKGNLVGVGSGRINYETGEIDFTAMPNAEFVVSLIHKSAHAGGINADTAAGKNTIQSIGARSVSGKMNTSVKVLAFN